MAKENKRDPYYKLLNHERTATGTFWYIQRGSKGKEYRVFTNVCLLPYPLNKNGGEYEGHRDTVFIWYIYEKDKNSGEYYIDKHIPSERCKEIFIFLLKQLEFTHHLDASECNWRIILHNIDNNVERNGYIVCTESEKYKET